MYQVLNNILFSHLDFIISCVMILGVNKDYFLRQ